jgi:hypothetical protein
MVLPAACGVWVCGPGAGRAAEAARMEARAGWFGVFAELPGYQRSFQAPVVAEGKKAEAYRQTATYEWTGSARKTLEVTLARDPAFRQKYAAETLNKEPRPPRRVSVGKFHGWFWNLDTEAGKMPDRVSRRLVVPLAEDRILLLEAKGPGPWEKKENLTDLAGRFDLPRLANALAAPPRTDFERKLEAFRVLRKGVPYSDVVAWVGVADKDVGSGVHVLVYRLADGSRVMLGFADFQSLLYVRHEGKDGKMEDLVK